MFKKTDKPETEEKFINIEAGVTGNLKFNGPVNLKINGRFEGELETRGVLIIGEKADVKAKIIKGETIIVAGKVRGDLISSKRLELSATGNLTGKITTPVLVVNEGAILKGECRMPAEDEKNDPPKTSKKKKSKPLFSASFFLT
jgi:cytoskeletal protein CcmA (bactofilin family)